MPVWLDEHQAEDHYIHRRNWIAELLTVGIRTRSRRRLSHTGPRSVRARPALSSADLTQSVKERAAEIGLSAVGVARYDPMYTFGSDPADRPGDIVIVCALEQSWAATQSIPSVRAEVAHQVTYARMDPMLRQLADFIESLGFRAVPGNGGVAIHYAVEAGLGQLGLNGQLLTPFAGSRCRLMLIQTDMPLTVDRPVDYGIPAICDACQVCVRRCPTGAITNRRQWHRGVYKAKIKTERCVPMVAQMHGCAVCMKVCPVQRYGLSAVLEEYAETGGILGKGSDELEGYVWPMDGKRYGPDEKPKEAISDEILHPIEFTFDARPTLPARPDPS
jgi:ferredoxin